MKRLYQTPSFISLVLNNDAITMSGTGEFNFNNDLLDSEEDGQ